LRANLERWRWQPRDFGRRNVRVDVPQFRLRTFDGPRANLEMRAVVGCRGWRTPLLHSAIGELVLNPAWNVPRSILVKEMIPKARRDSGYFERHGLRLTEVRGGDRRRVDPRSIDWSRVDPARTTLRARQPAGPKNPLGRVKFLFPSSYGVYLHGTPGRAAFDRPVRSLSHGCVRIEDELALARFALAPDATWSAERLDAALQQGPEQRVALSEPLPVHLLYFTAEVDANGSLSLAADPYGWDARLIAALGAR
jgi:murein L,D-transpeptidase YcbB/YkuD